MTLKAQSNGDVQVGWPPAAHARRYRVQMRRVGLETEFTNIKTLRGTSHLLRRQTPGQTIEIRIIPANKTGDAGQV